MMQQWHLSKTTGGKVYKPKSEFLKLFQWLSKFTTGVLTRKMMALFDSYTKRMSKSSLCMNNIPSYFQNLVQGIQELTPQIGQDWIKLSTIQENTKVSPLHKCL